MTVENIVTSRFLSGPKDPILSIDGLQATRTEVWPAEAWWEVTPLRYYRLNVCLLAIALDHLQRPATFLSAPAGLEIRAAHCSSLSSLGTLPWPGFCPAEFLGKAVAHWHQLWCGPGPVCLRGSPPGTGPSSSAEGHCSGSQWTGWPGSWEKKQKKQQHLDPFIGRLSWELGTNWCKPAGTQWRRKEAVKTVFFIIWLEETGAKNRPSHFRLGACQWD